LYSDLQTRPHVREGTTKLQTRYCLKEISRRKKNWSQVPDVRLTPGQTGQLTVGRKLTATARPSNSLLTLNGWNIPFVNSVKYRGIIFDKRMTWRLQTQMSEAKAFRTFIRIHSLFKIERLSANIKFTLHKALIGSVMTYACPAWEFTAEYRLLKLLRLQNKVLHTIGNFPRLTSVHDRHKALYILYVYGYITKSSRQQAEVIQNHENENVRYIGQGEARQKI
jgi:hypothetical protein